MVFGVTCKLDGRVGDSTFPFLEFIKWNLLLWRGVEPGSFQFGNSCWQDWAQAYGAFILGILSGAEEGASG